MKLLSKWVAVASVLALLVPVGSGCMSGDGSDAGNQGGASGSASGSAGVAGSGSGAGGAATGGSPTGGSPTGGSATGGSPTGGATTGGAAGSAGAGAGSGAGGAGMGGSGPSVNDGDSYVSNVTVTVHPDVRTILVVNWTQAMAAEQTWLEFSFESGSVLTSKAKPGATGAHSDAVLGVPGQTAVTVRVVSALGGVQHKTREYMGTTGVVPSGMPVPTVVSYDATIASPEKYLFGAVEDSTGGGDVDYYRSPTWLFVMDRRGRIVWYYTDLAVVETFGFARAARDGEYLVTETRPFGGGSGQRGILKMTLDRKYFEPISISGLSDCIDVTDDGSVLYDVSGVLTERTRAAQTRTIWSCRTAMGAQYNCYTNTVNWNQATNTIFLSFPEPRTVVEIDRASGMLVAQYGAGTGAYTFAPPLSMPPTAWSFGFQHFPNLNAAGNLMLSSHMPGYETTSNPVANQHAFLEFSIDRTARRLTEVWRYTDGPEWAHAKGMAIRLANGNTLANYGTGGVIREITRDKRTAFHVKFDTPGANDFYNKMIGKTFFVADLYALNGGGPP